MGAKKKNGDAHHFHGLGNFSESAPGAGAVDSERHQVALAALGAFLEGLERGFGLLRVTGLLDLNKKEKCKPNQQQIK